MPNPRTPEPMGGSATAASAHRQRQSTKSPQNHDFAAILSKNFSAHGRTLKSGRPKCAAETCPSSRFVITHWRLYRTIDFCILFCIFRNFGSGFSFLCAEGGRGVLSDRRRGKFPLSTPKWLLNSHLIFSILYKL